MKARSGLAAGILCLLGACQTPSKDYAEFHSSQDPVATASRITENVGACWFGGERAAFAEYLLRAGAHLLFEPPARPHRAEEGAARPAAARHRGHGGQARHQRKTLRPADGNRRSAGDRPRRGALGRRRERVLRRLIPGWRVDPAYRQNGRCASLTASSRERPMSLS